jgi:phage tail-like protein
MARAFSAVASPVQWRACRRENVTLDVKKGVLELTHLAEDVLEPVVPGTAGIAVDRDWVVYRALPEGAGIVRLPWLPLGRGAPRPSPEVMTLPFPPGLAPRFVACDAEGLLYVASGRDAVVSVVDPREQRVLANLLLGSEVRSLSSAEGHVYAATENGVLRVHPRGESVRITDAHLGPGERVSAFGTGLLVLTQRGTPAAAFRWLERDELLLSLPHALDAVMAGDGTLVVARAGSTRLRRFALLEGSIEELSPLDAPSFDGRGLVAGPGASVGYFTTAGDLRAAVPARVQRNRRGQVTTFALDSGQFQSRWGILRVDDCIPRGTSLRVRFVTDDEPDATTEELARSLTALRVPERPMPPVVGDGDGFHLLHRREDGAVQGTRSEEDFATYEVPTFAPPGRYLWVTLELSGDARRTPRVAALRVARSAHGLVKRLPRTFSRDAAAEGFLHRFLSTVDGFVSELEDRSTNRHLLLDARTAPADALPYAASLLGVVFDARLDEEARRRLLAQFSSLCRSRGTPLGLERLVELVLGLRPVRVLEDHALEAIRGPGTAHHFRLLVPGALDETRMQLVHDLVAAACPAHTSFELVQGALGMVLGGEIYTGITTVLGAGGSEASAFGGAVLGSGAALGGPRSRSLDPWSSGGAGA